jgi:hypothetical protein
MKMQEKFIKVCPKTIFIFLSTYLLFSICSCRAQEFHANYFIPKGYTGFVNIIFNDSASHNKVIKNGNTYTYFITGDPKRFSISSKEPESSNYVESYFYYSIDSLLEIPNGTSTNSDLSQIFLQASASKPSSKDGNGDKMVRIHQFYVADHPYRNQEFYTKYPDLENDFCE